VKSFSIVLGSAVATTIGLAESLLESSEDPKRHINREPEK